MIIPFPRPVQAIHGVSRSDNPNVLEIHLATPPTDGELINTWLYLKRFVPNPDRPEGWEPSDKSDPEEWQSA
jgi:hypothetical protein